MKKFWSFTLLILLWTMPYAHATLIVNGSFEEPVITVPFAVFTSIPGWKSSLGAGIEIQSGQHGSPFDGSQLVELDSFSPSNMFQDLPTTAGQLYRLQFAYSARPGIADNRIEVRWDGALVTLLNANGVGLSDTDWTVFSFDLRATSSTTRLEFADVSVSDAFGGYLDSVVVSEVPDHFLCYKAKPTKESEKFVPRTVSLADQFDVAARNFDVTRPLSLCTPADKNDEGITDPITHLKGYQIKLTKTDPPQAPDVKHAVRVTNQFGELLLDTLRPDRLLMPTAKSLTGPVDPPGLNNVDHYKCYKVRGRKGAPKFKPILGVSVSDQFIGQPPKLFDLKKPTRLCTPVDKNGEGIKNPGTHLLCYQAKPTKGQPRHQPVSSIFVNNQFGPEILQTVKEEDLCVPSAKTLLRTVGPVSDAEDSDNEDDLEE